MPRNHDLSWPMKREVWKLAGKLGKNKLSAIQQSLRYWTKHSDSEEKVPDTRTLARVIQELQSLSVQVLKTLPEYVWPLREDYAAIKELLQGRPQDHHDSASSSSSGKGQRGPATSDGGSNDRARQMAQPSAGGDLGTLDLKDGNTTYLLASSQELQELEALRRRHMELCLTMRDLAQLQQIVEDFRRLGQLAQNLVNQMSRIEKLAMFPGSCDLCSI